MFKKFSAAIIIFASLAGCGWIGHKSQINNLAVKVQGQSETLSALKAQLAGMQGQINQVVFTQVQSQMDTILSSQSQLQAAVDAQIQASASGQKAVDAALAGVQTQVNQAIADVAAGTASAADLPAKMQEIKAAAEAAVTGTATDKAAVDAALSSVFTSVDAALSAASVTSGDTSTLQAGLSSVQTTTAAATADITSLQTVTTALQASLNAVIADNAATKADVTTMQSRVAAAIASVSALATMQSTVAGIQAAVTAMQSQTSSTAADIASLQTQVANVSDEVSNVISAQVADLQGRLAASEANIGTLQSQLSNLLISFDKKSTISVGGGVFADGTTITSPVSAWLSNPLIDIPAGTVVSFSVTGTGITLLQTSATTEASGPSSNVSVPATWDTAAGYNAVITASFTTPGGLVVSSSSTPQFTPPVGMYIRPFRSSSAYYPAGWWWSSYITNYSVQSINYMWEIWCSSPALDTSKMVISTGQSYASVTPADTFGPGCFKLQVDHPEANDDPIVDYPVSIPPALQGQYTFTKKDKGFNYTDIYGVTKDDPNMFVWQDYLGFTSHQ